MDAAAPELFRLQRANQDDAFLAEPGEFVSQLSRISRAVIARHRNLGRVPCLQRRFVVVEDDPDPSGKGAPLRFDQVAHAFVDAPLARRGLPTRDGRRERGQQPRHRVPRRFECAGDLARGHAGGMSKVTGFSISRLTSAMNCAAVAP